MVYQKFNHPQASYGTICRYLSTVVKNSDYVSTYDAGTYIFGCGYSFLVSSSIHSW